MNQIYVAFIDWRTAFDDTVNWSILRYSFPNAVQEIIGRCRKRLTEKYGENPPEQIKARLEHELRIITGSVGSWNSSAYFLLAATLAEKCDSLGAPHNVRGCGGTSLVAYLTGITETNPLPPHKYCPECAFVEFVDAKKYESGFDLWSDPQQLGCCPHCGTKMSGDGHNLDATNLFGEDGDFAPYFELNVPQEVQVPLIGFLTELGKTETGFTRDEIEVEESKHNRLIKNNYFFHIQIVSLSMFSQIKELEEKIGVPARSIRLDEISIPSVFAEEEHIEFPHDAWVMQLLTETLHPVCFSDLVRASGYGHGTNVWEENAELLIRSGIQPKETIAHRDDVLRRLLQLSVERRLAVKMMFSTRKGRANRALTSETEALLREKGVPDWYLDSMRKIVYLFPKAHAIEYWIQYLRLIWYKCYYPDVFEAATSNIQSGGE